MPPIFNIELLTAAQKEYVLTTSSGMSKYGWTRVDIGWYSDGSRSMIVTEESGRITSEII